MTFPPVRICLIATLLVALAAMDQHAEAGAPHRIVSFNVCADQLVLALADPGQIVGLSPYATDTGISVVAEQARAFRRVPLQAESVIPLDPDLVLVAPSFRVVTQPILKALGFNVVEVDLINDLAGGWAWLNFQYEPWEASASPYFGAALAAIAVGTAPGNYANGADIQDRLKLLRGYLQRGADSEKLFNRLMALWASAKLPDVLSAVQRQAIIDAAAAKQQDDGGWATAALGAWKRIDGTALDARSDGYATGLITFVLLQAGCSRDDVRVSNAIAWLVRHQDPATGMWRASSLNKERDLSSDAGKFMSDAATAYAVLALTQDK